MPRGACSHSWRNRQFAALARILLPNHCLRGRGREGLSPKNTLSMNSGHEEYINHRNRLRNTQNFTAACTGGG